MSNNADDTITLNIIFEVLKADLLLAIEKGETITFQLKSTTQLEKDIFFEQHKQKILFLAQHIKNLDLSVRAYNHLYANITHCYQIMELWNSLKNKRGFSNGGRRNKSVIEIENVFKEAGLDLYNLNGYRLLIEAAKERKQSEP